MQARQPPLLPCLPLLQPLQARARRPLPPQASLEARAPRPPRPLLLLHLATPVSPLPPLLKHSKSVQACSPGLCSQWLCSRQLHAPLSTPSLLHRPFGLTEPMALHLRHHL